MKSTTTTAERATPETEGSLSEREARQVERANASERQPVIFIHGLWLLASSWERWAAIFEDAGYVALTPGWPDDPEHVEQARANPDALAGQTVGRVTAHMEAVIAGLEMKPAVIGHSLGGLFAQMIAGRGHSAVSVAIDPVAFRGVLPLPLATLKSALPVLRNPANRGRAVSLNWDEFRYGWANALDEDEGRELHRTFHVPGPGVPLFQAAMANLNPWSEAKVDTKSADRGPLLVISGEKDHTIPPVLARAAFKKQRRNSAVTEFTEVANRGHSLTIDNGWREVADKALAFVRRFAQPSLTVREARLT